MEVLKILDKPDTIDWEYDEEADVLYLSVGTPKPAVGVDIGEGVVVRYDEVNNEVVGLTVLGLRERVIKPPNHQLEGARRWLMNGFGLM